MLKGGSPLVDTEEPVGKVKPSEELLIWVLPFVNFVEVKAEIEVRERLFERFRKYPAEFPVGLGRVELSLVLGLGDHALPNIGPPCDLRGKAEVRLETMGVLLTGEEEAESARGSGENWVF
jgi:hypothetical protein